MNRTRRQLPDFRYWTIGDNTYYVPFYIKHFMLTMIIIVGMAMPIVLLAIVAWSFM